MKTSAKALWIGGSMAALLLGSTAQAQEACKSYLVVEGDHLRSIARRAYGDPDLYRLIFDANRDTIGAKADLILTGATLALPCKPGSTETAATSAEPVEIAVVDQASVPLATEVIDPAKEPVVILPEIPVEGAETEAAMAEPAAEEPAAVDPEPVVDVVEAAPEEAEPAVTTEVAEAAPVEEAPVPEPVEPEPAEPAPVEPAPAEPEPVVVVEVAPVEPETAEPAPVAVAIAEEVTEEPVAVVEAEPVEPAATETAAAEPVAEPVAEPATETAAVDPVPAEPATTTVAPDAGPIRILTGNGYAPFADEMLSGGGMYTQIVEMAIFRADPDLPYSLTFINDWQAHIDALLPSQAYDLSFPWVRPACEAPETLSAGDLARCNDFAFSAPYYEVVDGFFAAADSDLLVSSEASDFLGKRICRPEAYTTGVLETLGLGPDKVTMSRPLESYDCFEALASGAVDLVSIDTAVGDAILSNMGLTEKFRQNPSITSILTLHVIAHKSNARAVAMLKVLDEGAMEMNQSGEWWDIVSAALDKQ